jgi:hypothetical protein
MAAKKAQSRANGSAGETSVDLNLQGSSPVTGRNQACVSRKVAKVAICVAVRLGAFA